MAPDEPIIKEDISSMLLRHLILLLAVVTMTGCAAESHRLYHWDKYQSTLYQYYQQDTTSPEDQIASLKESIEKSRAKNKPVPPGLHAHLGLLYAKTGHGPEAVQEFEQEKVLFPEAAPFMDFLLNKEKGTTK